MSETVIAGTYAEVGGADLQPVQELVQKHYEGAATLTYPSMVVNELNPASQLASTADVVLKVPVAAPLLPKMSIVTITASKADPSMVGRRFRVKGSAQSGQVTSHRYPMEELP